MSETRYAFRRDEEGLTTVEYVIAVMMITAAVAISFVFLGDEVEHVISHLSELFEPAKCCD